MAPLILQERMDMLDHADIPAREAHLSRKRWLVKRRSLASTRQLRLPAST
jgi:hypothetical protein